MSYNVKRIKRKCLICENEFEIKITNAKKLCSDECRKTWNARPENKLLRTQGSKKAIIKKFEDEEYKNKVINKRKKTNLEKYGVENPMQSDSIKNILKESYIKKYGVDNPMKLPENVKKIKEAKKQNFNNENYNNREKAKKSNLERFGFEFPIQNEDILKLRENNYFETYGVKYPQQRDEIKNKTIETNLDKYGVPYPVIFAEKQDKFPLSELKLSNIYNTKILTDFSGTTNNNKFLYYNFECKDCGNIFIGTFSNKKYPICRKCFPVKSSSSLHLMIKSILDSSGVSYTANDKSLIYPYELDFYIPDLNLAIEVNGNYWHSEIAGNKDRYYHLNKTKLCNDKNIKLIHLFEDEIIYKFNIVESRILNLLKKTDNTIYARKCTIKEVNNKDKKIFLETNHIQGNCNDGFRYGLYYNDDLISLMTFGQNRMSRKSNKNEFELIRFANKLKTNVIGGFSKLLKFFIKTHLPKKIITFSDNRWSGINPQNTVYTINGFTFLKQTYPSYFYFINNTYFIRYNRLKFTKEKIVKLFNGDINKTEWEIAQENNMDRIWDCGTLKYEMII